MKKFILARPFVAVLLALVVGGILGVGVSTALGVTATSTVIRQSAAPSVPVPDTVPSTPPAISSSPSLPAEPSATIPTASTKSVPCPASSVRANSAAALVTALADAKPGDVITLGTGVFTGNFVAETSGTPDSPIFLCGTADSVLDGGDTSSGYVFHLSRASYWNLVGFSVSNGQKGIVADQSVGSVIRDLRVSHIGDEAIHLRTFSTDNLVSHNTIHDTGILKPKFGEGIYIGTAQKNWCSLTSCEPDKSDRNTISDNTIYATTAESIDIKEGTTSGIVSGNSFDGSKIDTVGASAWMNVKGNDWTITKNSGVNSPKDGFQTHEILKGWGTRNVFRDNSASVNGDGFGYAFTPVLDNIVACSNTAQSAGQGLSNVRCTTN